MKLYLRELFLLAFSGLLVSGALAQSLPIKVVVTVTPPYPVSVSYYADHPEQVLVQVMNMGREPQSFRLVGSINGLDNNVKVLAKDRGASDVITLNGNEARLLSSVEIQDLFDARHLTFTGINYRKTQIDDGLPEGLYSVCAYAVDAVQTNIQRSENSCSNAFQVTNLEPPIIISPAPDAALPEMPVQNALFTWTLPASAPPTTEYTVRMVEVIPGMNPNQAILSATTPTFFERNVQGNVLLYGPADPPLVPGRKYAFVVAARDPMQRAVFRNNGRSSVQVFTYQPSTTPSTPQTNAGNIKKGLDETDIVNTKNLNVLTASVKGRLSYAFPDDYAMKPFKAVNPVYNPEGKPVKENDQWVQLEGSNFVNLVKTKNQFPIGGYEYQLSALKPVANIKPLKKINVSLVQVYAFKASSNMSISTVRTYDAGGDWRIIAGFEYEDHYDFLYNGKSIKNKPLAQVLDTQTTGEDGSFLFSFAAKDTMGIHSFQTQTEIKTVENGTYYNQNTGEYETQYKTEGGEKSNPVQLFKMAMVVVESPYFCSPFNLINAGPGDNITLPDQIVLAKTFESRIYAVNDASANQAGGGNFAALQGINIELFRPKPVDLLMPKEEGQNLPVTAINTLQMGDYSNVYPSGSVDRVVAIDKTNGQGFITVPRLLRDYNSTMIAHAYSAKSTGTFNKMDAIADVSESGKNDLGGVNTIISPYVMFNGGYRYERLISSVILESKDPRIIGKVVESTKGLAAVKVMLTQHNGSSSKDVIMTTDKDGYFEFKNLAPGDYSLAFSKYGYNARIFGSADIKSGEQASFKSSNVFSLQKGQLLQTNEIQLVPASILVGIIKDEEGNQVSCDVQLADGAFYKTKDSGGTFEIPAQSGQGLLFKVFPRSDEYMEESYKLSVEAGQAKVNSAGVLLVHRNRHRMRFTVKSQGAEVKAPMVNAKVTVKGVTQTTNDKGQVEFVFESPGNKFLVSAKPPKNFEAYAHWEEEVEIPVTKTMQDYEILLPLGKMIQVTVNETINGKLQPSNHAKVYVKQLNTYWDDNPANYAEVFTDEKGTCVLKGIPSADANVEIFVSKSPDGNGSYTANSKTVSLKNGPVAKVDFTLNVASGFAVTEIWGYPVQIEKIKSMGNNSYQVSGSFIHLPGNPNFDVLDNNTRLDFKDQVFVQNPSPVSQPAKELIRNDGSPFQPVDELVSVYITHIPKMDYVFTLHHSIPVKIYKKLQGRASGYGVDSNNNPPLIFSKTKAGKAVLKANVKLDLASFKGAYDLQGDIHLGSSPNSPVVEVLSSDSYEKRKFFVGQGSSNSGNNAFYFKNLPFSVHEFSAEADVAKSYVHSDTVKLFTLLHTNIPTMVPSDLKLQAGFITILPNQILPFEGGDDITFSLEKWKVIGQKPSSGPLQQTITLNGNSTAINVNVNSNTWRYDKNNGGIVIPKAVVNTGIIGVTLQNLIIKPDRLIADQLELDKKNGSALTLGGIVPLSLQPETQIYFTYDPNSYHDNKPHWKLSMLNSKGKAAEIKNLDGLEDSQSLTFESMNLFSDNQQQLSGSTFKELVFRKVLHFTPTSIDVGSDYFTLVGDASLDVPNLSNGGKKIAAQILYNKVNGKAVFNYKPMYFDIEGAGKVTFQATDLAQSQSLTGGKFTADGTIKVYDDISKKSFTMQGRLFHQKNKNSIDTYIEVTDKQKFPLGAKYLDIKAGIANSGMRVQGGSWEPMVLKTTMPTGPTGFEILKDEEEYRSLSLVVDGAIHTDPSSGMVGIKGMDTGMGSISMFYDFNTSELRGNFFFNPVVPLNLGLVNITSANVSMAVGEHGVFIMNNGTGELAPGGLPLPLEMTASAVTGYYTKALPAEDQETLIKMSVQKSLPDFMASGIKGIYTVATAKTVPLDKDYDLTGDAIPDWVANVRAYATAGLAYEVRSYVDYKSSTSFELFSGLYSIGAATMGGEATILGCGPKAKLSFDVQLATSKKAVTGSGLSLEAIKSTLGSVTMTGCGSVGGTLQLKVCVRILGCAGFSLTKHLSLHCEVSPPVNKGLSDSFKFWFTLDDCGLGLPVSKLNESGY